MITNNDVSCRIYVADLAAYNSGILHGVWIDATDDAEDMKSQVQTMLKYGEEWAIHDHEGFEQLSEYESFEEIAERVSLIQEHGDVARAVFKYNYFLDDAKQKLENFSGKYDCVRDFAYEFVTEVSGEISEENWLFHHIDFDSVGRELEMDYDIYEYCGEIYVFYPG